VMFAERQDQILLAKPNLLLERKSLNVKVLFIIKVKNMKNVSLQLQLGNSSKSILDIY